MGVLLKVNTNAVYNLLLSTLLKEDFFSKYLTTNIE
jgi:hypothetical protein